MPFPDWMRQHGWCFPIASEHFGPARLHITPTGYEKDTNGKQDPDHRDRVYGIYVTARFEDDGRKLQFQTGDFVPPECFHALAELLADSTNQGSPVQLLGDDGHNDIGFQRGADGRLRITCTTPSRGWRVDCLRLQLECTVEPESLTEARERIAGLLDVVAGIDSAGQ